MSTDRCFTARADAHGLVISFDGGADRLYDRAVAKEILAVLDTAPSSTPIFTAATAASFAEAEQSKPNPVTDGPILDRASAHRTQVDRADTVSLGPIITDRSNTLAEVLDQRRSDRELHPIALEDLATLLVRSARIITCTYDEQGIETSYRPHPSAGALHPLTIEVIADDVTGLIPGCWSFDPFRCDLVRSARPTEAIARARQRIADAARTSDLPATIVIVAHPARTLSRYPAGTAHVWRDAGALLATLHLAAIDLGLASSIIGTSGVLDHFDPSALGVVDVGALIVGRPGAA